MKASSPPARRRALRRRFGLARGPDANDSSDIAVLGADEASPRDASDPDLRPRSPVDKARKGVTYARGGAVVCCRFCEILRSGDADFVYEDDAIAVFRPLAPVVESHVLVVPRCHIRNINQLTNDHAALLQRMRAVAERVLLPTGTAAASSSTCGSSAMTCKFAFHKPPFNSIDHVHMHAFRTGGGSQAVGYFGAIKYRTETWWCRSFEEVLGRVATTTTTTSSGTPSSSSSLSSSSSSSEDDHKGDASHHNICAPMREASSSEAWRLGDQRPRALA